MEVGEEVVASVFKEPKYPLLPGVQPYWVNLCQ